MEWLREKADALDADYEISQKAGALADEAAEKGDHLRVVSLCPCVSLLQSLSLLLSMILSLTLYDSLSYSLVSQWERWLTKQLGRP